MKEITINNIEKKIVAEASSVTTFTFNMHTLDYLNELVKYNKVSKQKLLEVIIEDKIFLADIINNPNCSISSNDRKKIISKQRISKKRLKLLNQISKKYGISRDSIIEKSIQVLHENLSNKIQENYNSLIKFTENFKSISRNIINIENDIKKNDYLSNTYEKLLYKIISDVKKFESRIDSDIKNYKINQWTLIIDE